jgi:hypothetical protein
MSTTQISALSESDAQPSTRYPNIAFIGGAGAGKTTAAEWLVSNYNYERRSFAKYLKIMLGTSTDRARLQEFGTDVVRAYDEDAWVRLFVHDLTDGNNWPITVDDARFPNELWKLKELGFVIVRIVADEDERVDRLIRMGKLQDRSQLGHASETALDEFPADYTLYNDNTRDGFHDGIYNIVCREVRRS